MGREREGPKNWLGDYNGKLQCDGYGAYDQIGGAGITLFGCMAYARRKFFDASKLDPKDAVSVAIIARIGKLYDVEREQDYFMLWMKSFIQWMKDLIQWMKNAIQ